MSENKSENKPENKDEPKELLNIVEDGLTINKESVPFMAFADPGIIKIRESLVSEERQNGPCDPLKWDLKKIAARIVGNPEWLKNK